MITDGKPSAMFEGGRLYKNSFGLDRKIVNRVLDEAVKCRRERITITTFMIASDPYLQGFVRELTEANKGRAYYASLDELGGYIFEDYIRNRRKKDAVSSPIPLEQPINYTLYVATQHIPSFSQTCIPFSGKKKGLSDRRSRTGLRNKSVS